MRLPNDTFFDVCFCYNSNYISNTLVIFRKQHKCLIIYLARLMKRVGKNYRKYVYCIKLINGCIQIMFKISSNANQKLVKNAEQFGQLLAQTLNEEVLKTIKTKNNIGD